MAYFASIHKASSVSHAVKAHFLSPTEPSLIVAKTNRVEIYEFSSNRLNLRTHFAIYGKVTALLTLRPANSRTDHLFIATDRFDYLTISWDTNRGTVRNERKAQDVSDRFLRDAPHGPIYLSDPAGRMLGLHVYEGLFLAIPIILPTLKTGRKKHMAAEVGNLDEHTSIRMKELKILDMAFLYNTLNPVLAVLHKESGSDCTQLVTYEVVKSGGSCELKEWKIKVSDLEAEANILIPVPGSLSGVLIIGEQTVTYVSENEPVMKRGLYESSVTYVWGMIDGLRFFLGDELGNLKLLWLEADDDKSVCDIKVEMIGRTSMASKLIYLDNGHVFVGSQHGDSQLVKVSSTEPKCQVVQEFESLAPILDFQVLYSSQSGMDDAQNVYSSGQTRIVTGSGGFRDGGLRSMKSGVGLEDAGILIDNIEGAQGVWALKSNPNNRYDDTLVVSSIYGTRILHFEAHGGVDELQDFFGFSLGEETILACNLGERLLQVTGSGAKMIDSKTGTILAEINQSAKITNASVNDDYLVCNSGGTSIEVYGLQNNLEIIRSRSFENEIACLFASSRPKGLCAVGFWGASSVCILSLPGLETIAEERIGIGDVTIPRSIILAQVLKNEDTSLLVGMGDGTLHVFSVDNETTSLTWKKSISLGTQAFYFYGIPQENDIVNVFAACDHPSLIYGDDGRLGYSSVTANRVTHLCPFNAEGFPSCMAVIAAGELKISKVDTARTVHIKKLGIGEVVRRVAYSAKRKLLGIATVKSDIDPKTGRENFRCFMRIIDDVAFTKAGKFALGDGELVETIICATLDNGDGTKSDKFILGTGIQDLTEDGSGVSGRILVFEIEEGNCIKLAAEKRVEYSVKCLCMSQDKIVAALGHSVNLYSFYYPSHTIPQLDQLASWPTQSDPCDLSVWDDMVTVGDLMKGPLLLKIVREDNVYKFEGVSRTFKTTWTTAVEMISKDTIVSSDSEGNLSVWQKNPSVVAEDQKRLEILCDVKLGEMVNRIRRVENYLLPDAVVQPKAYLATVEGSVYLLGDIQKSQAALLIQLQANLTKTIKSVGDLSFNRFRAFATINKEQDEPNRFVDGDFIEQFLELPEDVAEDVVNGVGDDLDSLGATVSEVRFIVEGLKRLR
ncbi:mono-functional DNA-alkylating methyl methanesulfonate N-term-domain-containing protein [Geopyxis carbonaria]|nr:mono-functional DNA-alkylating methyl methanesulfonate N-term-domain-containing protein [Geopyxis carbonaria]